MEKHDSGSVVARHPESGRELRDAGDDEKGRRLVALVEADGKAVGEIMLLDSFIAHTHGMLGWVESSPKGK